MPHVISFVGIVSTRVWIMMISLEGTWFSARQGRERPSKVYLSIYSHRQNHI